MKSFKYLSHYSKYLFKVITGMATGNIDGDNDFYETAQHFFGGALSGMSGANMGRSMAGGSKSYALGK